MDVAHQNQRVLVFLFLYENSVNIDLFAECFKELKASFSLVFLQFIHKNLVAVVREIHEEIVMRDQESIHLPCVLQEGSFQLHSLYIKVLHVVVVAQEELVVFNLLHFHHASLLFFLQNFYLPISPSVEQLLATFYFFSF